LPAPPFAPRSAAASIRRDKAQPDEAATATRFARPSRASATARSPRSSAGRSSTAHHRTGHRLRRSSSVAAAAVVLRRREMELGDKAVGFLLTLTSLSIFTYYTFWVIILPFVDSDHFVHKYFLPQDYAILIPVIAGVVLLSFLSVFVGLVMLKSKKKMKTT
ncbi:unnamed protein product, partial [Urochloa humidicola]